MIEIHPIPAFESNYIWLIETPNNDALIVDPGEANSVLNFIGQRELNPIAILITHSHYDHINGVNDLLAHHPMPVYSPASERIPHITHLVGEGDTVTLAGIEFSIWHTPGHLPEHISYFCHINGEPSVFCGDTLFACGCGRIFDGTPTQLKASLDRLVTLPDDTKIYCAHEYTETNLRFALSVEPNNQDIQHRQDRVAKLRAQGKPSLPSTIVQEKLTNPFLRCDHTEVQQAISRHAGLTPKNTNEVFRSLREWKDSFR